MTMTTNTTIRSYTELCKLKTFEERFEYLKIDGSVGKDTFGHDRYLNQRLYRSTKEWRQIRDFVITRDNGCDLGMRDRPIPDGVPIYVHHLNPITADDIMYRRDYVLDPEYLVSMTFETHNAIHYSDINQLVTKPIERTKNDTCPWRHD